MSNYQTQPLPPPPPVPPQQQPEPKKDRAKWWLLAAGFVLGLIVMSIATSSEPQTITATTPTVTKTVAGPETTVTQSVEVPGPEKTVTVKAEPPKPETAFGPGAWLVGEDIAPGKYKTAEQVGEGCYWEITTGPNGDDIVANQFVAESGGIQRVTLKKGQQFDSNDCGDWVKAG